jgi:acetoin utilization deacetylase AcuC-like enzyme
MMPNFAVYLHPETVLTSKPAEQITFAGRSQPYFSQVRQALAGALAAEYPSLPLRQADFEEYGRVHTAEYLRQLTLLSQDLPLAGSSPLGHSSQGLEHCLPGYRYSLGGMLEAIDQMRRGNLERAYCFSLGGHHAFPDWGHGYCLLNPMAAAARYAQANGFGRILIVDYDLHHGDGTQAIFAHDPTVYCLSIHSIADLYMAVSSKMREATTTAATQLGHCNLPLLGNTFPDDFFEQMKLSGRFYRGTESLPAFADALSQLPFTPNLIFIFSGYDAHRNDCGRDTHGWTNDSFQQLTHHILDIAHHAACPVLSVHGGGYNLPVTISSALAHISTLA